MSAFEKLQIKNIDAAIDEFIGKVSVSVTENYTDEVFNEFNPVDTGFSRANWISKIGTRFDGTDGEYDETFKGTGRYPNSEQEAGIKALNASYTISQGVINITNNVDYISELNFGNGPSARPAFVQKAIAAAITKTKKIKQ